MAYYYKATLDKGVSGYDESFHYKLGKNIEPNVAKTNVVCSTGIHLAKTIWDAYSYVPNATEFYLATCTEIYGKDKSKIRTGECNILYKIPMNLIKEYKAKLKSLEDEYRAKCKPLDDEYRAKCDPLDDEYWAKCKLLDQATKKKILNSYKRIL